MSGKSINFNEFVQQVKAEIQKLYEGKRKLIIQKVPGNNGIVHVGINLECKNGQKIPTIYLDTYYESFLAGEMTIDNAAKDIYDAFSIYEMTVLPSISFENFEEVKTKVIYRLVNYERNQTLLKDIPYIVCCDLAVIFCLLVENNGNDCVTALIYNNHMIMWKTDTYVLYELAKENTPKLLPFSFHSMPDVLKNAFTQYGENGSIPQIIDNTIEKQAESPLYVLTNIMSIYGAVVVLYDGVLKDISERIGKDLIILPSSIHEVLLIPYEDTVSIEKLCTMVKDINETDIPVEEVLSDTVYLYSKRTNRISIAVEETGVSRRADVL